MALIDNVLEIYLGTFLDLLGCLGNITALSIDCPFLLGSVILDLMEMRRRPYPLANFGVHGQAV